MLLVPALEYLFEVWASLRRLLQNIESALVQVELYSKGSHHQIQNDALVVQIINRVVYNVLYIFSIMEYSFVPNVPGCLSDQVGQKYDFDLVKHEYFTDSPQQFAYGIEGAERASP